MVSVAAMALLLAVFSGSQPAASGPGEFVAVAGAERWLRLGSEGGAAWLVQTELPQERLTAYGLPYDPGRAATHPRPTCTSSAASLHPTPWPAACS